ncbi:hypothetical protein VTL71DRAFT_7681 [Oculimacula yallundae]|uniref:Uncharacterized protein n=1 Tax=Oculimacula yallundae TaxID=86028 RepID=A0ABR4BUT1_9HELO
MVNGGIYTMTVATDTTSNRPNSHIEIYYLNIRPDQTTYQSSTHPPTEPMARKTTQPPKSSLSRILTLTTLFTYHILLLASFGFSILTSYTNTHINMQTNTHTKTTTITNPNLNHDPHTLHYTLTKPESALPFFARSHNIHFDASEGQDREMMERVGRVVGVGMNTDLGMGEVRGVGGDWDIDRVEADESVNETEGISAR